MNNFVIMHDISTTELMVSYPLGSKCLDVYVELIVYIFPTDYSFGSFAFLVQNNCPVCPVII